MQLYEEAKNLYETKGWGRRRIGKHLGISPSTVSSWLYKGKNPTRAFNRTNLNPSYSLSYVIGVYCGDGSVSDSYASNTRCGRIRLTATDKDFVEEFRKHLVRVIRPRYDGAYPIWKEEPRAKIRQTTYGVTGYSTVLGTFLKENIEKQKECVLNYPSGFLKGLFDSEGSLGRGEIYCEMTERDVLKWTQKILDKLGIKSSIRNHRREGREVSLPNGQKSTTTKTTYRLEIFSKSNLIKFKNKVGFSIKRKQSTLNQIVENYS